MDETSVFKKLKILKTQEMLFFKAITMMKQVWLFIKYLSVVAPARVQFEKQYSMCENIIQFKYIPTALS